jgi:hypothetical protein
MKIEVSFGEILDKVSILAIKLNYIKDPEKLINIAHEFQSLTALISPSTFIDPLYNELCSVNQELWHIEDDIREKERIGEFDGEFIRIARNVYITNDKRAEIKRLINIKYGSEFVEEKSYNPY